MFVRQGTGGETEEPKPLATQNRMEWGQVSPLQPHLPSLWKILLLQGEVWIYEYCQIGKLCTVTHYIKLQHSWAQGRMAAGSSVLSPPCCAWLKPRAPRSPFQRPSVQTLQSESAAKLQILLVQPL